MSRSARVLAAAVLAAALPVAAYAADVDGSASATFTNPQPTDPGIVTTGVGTSTFTWGDATGTGTGPNSLSFAGGVFSSPFETPFKLGTLTYYNGSTILGTTPGTVDLSVSLSFTNPVIPPVLSSFTMTLNSTPNTGDADANADFVTFGSLYSSTTFMIGGTLYNVAITGFQNVVGDGFLPSDATQFHVREDSTASADLYAEVTTRINPVPEPDTYALLLGGLGVLSAVLRRRGLKCAA